MRHEHIKGLARGALYDGQLKSTGEIAWWIAEHNKIDLCAVRLVMILGAMASDGELLRVDDGRGEERVVMFALKRPKRKFSSEPNYATRPNQGVGQPGAR